MMTSSQSTHEIEIGDTLESVARTFGLSGWQGLYFAPTNTAFRDRYPSPWRIPIGAVISLPASTEEQRFALTERTRLLDLVRRSAMRIGREQALALAADSPAATPPLARMTRRVADTTLDAIQLLKAADGGSSLSNWALARDAARRWPLSGQPECASLLSLLARAAESVCWGIPEQTAQAWCDAANPSFWGKSLVMLLGRREQRMDLDATLPALRIAQQAAVSRTLQQIDSLHGGVVTELGRLARTIECSVPAEGRAEQ